MWVRRVKEGWHSSILTWLHCLCTFYCVCCCWQCAALPPDEDHLWRNSSMMSSWHPPDPRDTSAIVVSEPTVRFVQVRAGDVPEALSSHWLLPYFGSQRG